MMDWYTKLIRSQCTDGINIVTDSLVAMVVVIYQLKWYHQPKTCLYTIQLASWLTVLYCDNKPIESTVINKMA